jgi:hypothetical protein
MSIDPIADFYRAWNAGAPDEVVRLFGEEGTFVDPLSRRPLAGDALRAHVGMLLAATTDLRFVVDRIHRSDDRAFATWSLRGTCKGALDDELVAHDVAFVVDGVDVFVVCPLGEVRSVQRHFDRRALADQLGLQTIVEPIEVGSMSFGYSLRDWVSTAKPSLLAMTWIQARDETEKASIRGYARKIVRGFHDIPGFIGVITGFTGLHGFTLTAWEHEDALRAGVHGSEHVDAMRGFHKGISAGVFTSVWQPLRLNRLWLRCLQCGAANDAHAEGRRCAGCTSPLPPAPPYV